MSEREHPLTPRLEPLLASDAGELEGPDGQCWRVEIEEQLPAWLAAELPEGCLVFAGNGVGDNLFLSPDAEAVMVRWHEGPRIEAYCDSVAELRPDQPRPPSDHPPVRYWRSGKPVRLGDRVRVRSWLFFAGRGEVVYVPGLSPRRPGMERGGLAWVGIELEGGGRVETIIMPDGALKRSVSLLARSGASRDDDSAEIGR